MKPMKATDLKPLVDWSKAEPYAGLSQYLTPAYKAEPKIDGCGIYLTFGEKVNVITSATRGLDRSGNFPHLRDAILPQAAGTMIAAELVAAGGAVGGLLSTSVGLMVANPPKAVADQQATGPARLYVFDLLQAIKLPATDSPYRQRRLLLEMLMRTWRKTYPSLPVQIVPSWPATAASIDRALDEGYEGVMVKRLTSAYASGKRTAGWYKLKMSSTVDVAVSGFRPGENGNAGLVGSFEVSIMDRAGLRPVGHTGNFTDDFRRQITAPDGTLKPEWYGRVLEVSAQGVGAQGNLRHCLMKRVRPDKGPDDCGIDQLDALPRV